MEKEKKVMLIKKYRLDEYERNLVNQDKGVQTITTYLRNCLFFFEWVIESSGDVEIDQLTTIDLQDYRSHLLNIKQSKDSSINLAINSLKSLCSYYKHRGYMKENIAANLKTVKVNGNPAIKDIPESVFKKFRREIYRGPTPYKHLCVLVELLRNGLRVSEITDMKLSDLELQERNSKMTIHGKSGSRTLIMHPDLANAIKDYLVIRTKIPTDSEYLLLSERKDKFHRSSIYRIVANTSRKIGPIKDEDGNTIDCLSPHMFRHHFCTKLIRSGVDLVTVARMSGHSDINTLMNFYVHVDKEMMEDALSKL